MWIPSDAGTLEKLINDRSVEESTILDFKGELPPNSRELAKDVASMANDGGVLVFGVGEDDSGAPTILSPFQLEGAAERISSMIRSSLAEPPVVEVKTLPRKDSPDIGYLLVIVPASPRAPHMVVVKGDNRYYGRGPKGNIPLTEGEVARLYQRRQVWESDRGTHLDLVIRDLDLGAKADFGFLYMYSRPAAASSSFLGVLGDREEQRSVISQLISEAASSKVHPHQFSPDLQNGYIGPISAGWKVRTGGERIGNDTTNVLDVEVRFDGELRLVMGRAAAMFEQNRFALFEVGLVRIATRFLVLAGRLYQKLGYFGAVDVGLAVTGISGATAFGAIKGTLDIQRSSINLRTARLHDLCPLSWKVIPFL
jgi:hypothetical protein